MPISIMINKEGIRSHQKKLINRYRNSICVNILRIYVVVKESIYEFHVRPLFILVVFKLFTSG